MSDSHPDLETLSASLDGEDEDVVRAHLAGCAACRAQVDGMRAARDAVARPVAPAPSALRERAIAAALDGLPVAEPGVGTTAVGAEPAVGAPPAGPPAAGPVPPPTPLRRSGPSWRSWLVGSAAAAVLAIVVGTVALVGRGTERGDNTALSAGPAQDEKATAGAAAGDAAAVDGGDLGDVPDVATLRSRLPRYGVSVVSPAAGSGGVAAAESTRQAQPAAPPVAEPRQIGTRVCEIEARTARPQLGVVVYFANARVGGTPAVVLGFAPSGGLPPATILVLAPQEQCRLLGETTLP